MSAFPTAPDALFVCAALLVALQGCRTGDDERASATAQSAEVAASALLELPPDWRSASPFAFERSALAWPDEGVRQPLAETALQELARALASNDEVSVRAAVLLARSRDPRAAEALLARLEERVEHEAAHEDAADVVAAAALWGWDFAPDAGARLAALASGERPHPDLEVRIECAASALGAGRDEVIPFLLRVLRAKTPAERLDPPDWPPSDTLAWCKSRAAEALSRRADDEVTFRPDGSLADQMRWADELAAALSR